MRQTKISAAKLDRKDEKYKLYSYFYRISSKNLIKPNQTSQNLTKRAADRRTFALRNGTNHIAQDTTERPTARRGTPPNRRWHSTKTPVALHQNAGGRGAKF